MADYAKDVLVDTQWVEDHLDDDSIRIVEVDENPALYAEAHIPGAIGFDWQKDLQDQVKRDFLGPEDFGELFGSTGCLERPHGGPLRRPQQLVRRLHLLVPEVLRARRRAAHERPAREVDRGGAAHLHERPPHIRLRPSRRRGRTSIRAMRDEMLKLVGTDTRLVDVRSPQEFSGELIAMAGYEQEGAQRAGHIPGAISVPWAQAVQEDGTFKSADELRELYESKGALDGNDIVAYCRIGERSAHTWFVLHELLGQDNVRTTTGPGRSGGTWSRCPWKRTSRHAISQSEVAVRGRAKGSAVVALEACRGSVRSLPRSGGRRPCRCRS